MRFPAFPLLCLCLVFAGCAGNYSAPPATTPATGVKLSGSVHGGQQPITGAHVYLFAANTNGYEQPSVSLLNPTATRLSDSIGAYVTTDDQGAFTITGDYSCTPNTQVYLYALSGNPGPGVNSGAGLLASLGNCPSSGSFFATLPFISVNEVTTVAAAYAMAGFATDATHVSSSGTPLAQTGIANAFANAANLADISTGTALITTPAGNGNVNNTLINSLANVLAACVNSNGPGSTPCSTLFSNSLSGGTSGTTPTDTATAIINIAHNPGANIAALFTLPTATSPFAPSLASAPNDLSIFIRYNFPNINSQSLLTVAIDGSGNAWIPNDETNSIVELASTGSLISPSAGYASGQLSNPSSVAIDDSGNAWVANINNNSVTTLSSSGAIVSPLSGFTGGGLNNPLGIAIDSAGGAWIANDSGPSVTKFSNTGTAISPASGFTGGGINHPVAVAIDSSGNAWTANISNNTVSKFSTTGVALSPPSGYAGGGLDGPFSIAIDSFGNAWIANGNLVNSTNTISKFANDGTPISPSTGFTGGGLNSPTAIAIDGSGSVWIANLASSISRFSNSGVPISPSTGYSVGPHFLNAIAVDGSGSVWVTTDTAVAVFIGAATPVVTPIATGVKNNTLGSRRSGR
jgi:hypothetical protein